MWLTFAWWIVCINILCMEHLGSGYHGKPLDLHSCLGIITPIVFWSLTSLHVSMGFLGLWRYNTYIVLGWNHHYLDVLTMLVGKKTNISRPNGGEKWWRNHLPNGSLMVISDWWQKENKSPLTNPRIQVSHEKNPYYFPLYWLVYRDPYNGLVKSP